MEIEKMEINKGVLGSNYSVRSPIYQPNQEKLNFNYKGVALNINKSTEKTTKPISVSPFLQKLMAEVNGKCVENN